ncbi:MAG: SHOCT domain-containing protein [Candidatus Nanopelagicales bacterium]
MEFGQFLWSLLLIFFMIMYFMILFSVVIDLFRNHQMGGFAKALWIIFLIFIPLISLLVYVIVYGKGMAERQQSAVVQAQQDQDAYIKQVAGTSPAEQIAQAQQLLNSGAISQDEFDKLKSKALG